MRATNHLKYANKMQYGLRDHFLRRLKLWKLTRHHTGFSSSKYTPENHADAAMSVQQHTGVQPVSGQPSKSWGD